MSAPLSWCRVLTRQCLLHYRVPTITSHDSLSRGHNSSQRNFSSTTFTAQEASEATELSPPQDAESKSLQHIDYFGVRDLVTIHDLFKARVHLGHKKGLREPHMAQYLYGNRLDTDIFDLDKTMSHFQDALNFTAHIAYRGGVILFISRHRQTIPLVEKTALECGEYANCRYWKGGTFTNASTQFDTITRLPELCIFINTQNNTLNRHKALIDCAKMLIPTVGIVDSNCDPRLIAYPVPGNDDTPVAVQYYCDILKEAILRGKAKRKEDGLD